MNSEHERCFLHPWSQHERKLAVYRYHLAHTLDLTLVEVEDVMDKCAQYAALFNLHPLEICNTIINCARAGLDMRFALDKVLSEKIGHKEIDYAGTTGTQQQHQPLEVSRRGRTGLPGSHVRRS